MIDVRALADKLSTTEHDLLMAVNCLVKNQDPERLAKILFSGDMSPVRKRVIRAGKKFILECGDMSPENCAVEGHVPDRIRPSGSHTGSKGVDRARANGRSERKVVPA